ncbi:hypothetical protein J3A83DRAFT_4400851 [Scleroderma citrinum]
MNRHVRDIHPELVTDADDDVSNEVPQIGKARKCPKCGRVFRAPRDLERHLRSPAHGGVVYTCLNTLCQVKFKTFSAFLQHLERNSCDISKADNDRVRNTLKELLIRV